MHPYHRFPIDHFWGQSVSGRPLDEIPYDPNPKFRFLLDEERFGTAGSCFAQHFGRELVARGGRLCITESQHPLVPHDAGHGYGAFSARYGNIYSCRQLRDLLEQALGVREPLFIFEQREDGRWVDMLRPRAVPEGFSSPEECRADRIYHLKQVRSLIEECSVFVFTLGLTEAWLNRRSSFAYGICPGVIAGAFEPAEMEYRNLSFAECLDDLGTSLELMARANLRLKVLLTVSPVMLVATAESRGVIQSSVASKSILRAVADQCTRNYPFVDYFPSYEIIAGPQARGIFFDQGGRDVVESGVKLVMDVFFRSRMVNAGAHRSDGRSTPPPDWQARSSCVAAALKADCDELFLDIGNSP